MRRWVLLALVFTGCGFSGVHDKSGGRAVPTTLALLTNEGPGFLSRTQLEHFAAEARRRSGGVLRVRIVGPAPDEQALADRVRRGRVALALVPSRTYDELRALQTPFLLRDPGQLRRVIADRRLTAQLLGGLTAQRVTGFALLPDAMRHPFGYTHAGPLLAPGDYRGAVIRAQPSAVTFALLRELGARPESLNDAQTADAVHAKRLAGAESDFDRAITTLQDDTIATANVTFFPRVNTLVANPQALARLNGPQRRALTEAAAETATWAARTNPSEAQRAQAYCRNGGAVVWASDDEVAALETAARPVVHALEREPRLGEQIAELRAIAGPPTESPAPPCGSPSNSFLRVEHVRDRPTPIDGIWRNRITIADMRRNGAVDSLAYQNIGLHTIRLHHGRALDGGTHDPHSCRALYTVHGDRLTWVWNRHDACTGDFVARWNVRNGQLQLRIVAGGALDGITRTVWGSKPFRRIE